jgi:tetratricopeptide (TPR) repeat protein
MHLKQVRSTAIARASLKLCQPFARVGLVRSPTQLDLMNSDPLLQVSLQSKKADELARRGLVIRPGSPMLVNCGTFALASMGDIEILLRTLSKDADERQLLVAKANQGLIAFRKGNFDRAKQLYKEAIEGFDRIGETFAHASAQLYFAREAILANDPEASALLAQANEAAGKLELRSLQCSLEQVELSLLKQQKREHICPRRRFSDE